MRARIKVAWMALMVSFFAGCATLHIGAFVDEADNLAIGLLLTRGYVLYRDIFSHHFPFAYYWVAGVISLFGKSIGMARLSVVFFQVMSFAIAMKLSRLHLPLGAASLVWNIIRPVYVGNLVIYNVFCGTSLVVVFSAIFAIVSGKVAGSVKHWVAVGLFSVIALLSDPLSVYPIGVAIIFLVMVELKQGSIVGLLIVIGGAFYAGYLLISGAYGDFIRDAIYFNSQIYGKYVSTDPLRFRKLFEMSVEGLELLDSTWMNLNPAKAIPLPSHSYPYNEFDLWAFTGFLYRLSVILASLFSVAQRRYKVASFIYFYAAALLIIDKWGFRGISFVMVALVVSMGLITGQWVMWQARSVIFKAFEVTIKILVGCMVIWLVIRVGAYMAPNHHSLSYERYVQSYEYEVDKVVNELNCSLSSVTLAYYPGNPYIYWSTDMRPVSRYILMWPWVAEIALPEVINRLDEGQALVHVADTEIWGRYKARDYLAPLYSYLDENYVKLDDGWYISSDLAQQCQREAYIRSLVFKGQQPGDVIVSLVPELSEEFLSRLELPLPPVYELPFDSSAEDLEAQALFNQALRDAERVWLITWYGAGDHRNWYEEQLRQRWFSVREEHIDSLRLSLLARPPAFGEWVVSTAAFEPIRLSRYRMQNNNCALFVELTWLAIEPITQDYTIFVHVLDKDMHLIAQQDRQPLGGCRPTTGWLPGEVLVDRFAFPLTGEQTSDATIAVGWYSWPSLERLTVQCEDETCTDTTMLIPLEKDR